MTCVSKIIICTSNNLRLLLCLLFIPTFMKERKMTVYFNVNYYTITTLITIKFLQETTETQTK